MAKHLRKGATIVRRNRGTGKGQFIIGMAKKYPEINFIGMEIQEGAVAVAARKADEDPIDLPNEVHLR